MKNITALRKSLRLAESEIVRINNELKAYYKPTPTLLEQSIRAELKAERLKLEMVVPELRAMIDFEEMCG